MPINTSIPELKENERIVEREAAVSEKPVAAL
jgi:hypothetical protein